MSGSIVARLALVSAFVLSFGVLAADDLGCKEVNEVREECPSLLAEIKRVDTAIREIDDSDLCLKLYYSGFGIPHARDLYERPTMREEWEDSASDYRIYYERLLASRRDKIASEAVRRGLLTKAQVKQGTKAKLGVGSNICIVYALLGRPSRENRTFNARGRSVQHVYRTVYGKRATYYYSRNGVVTGWQD